MKSIFKKSFLEGFQSADINTISVTAALLIAAAIGFYIFLVYRIATKKTFYSKSFNISLLGITIITSAIIVTIQSSIVVSLGMVGALSIVRFRTAIKDPMDLMFLFWSIATGIICGAGFSIFAIILSVILTLSIFVLQFFPNAKAPMILIVNAVNIDAEENIIKKVNEYVKYSKVKCRNITASSLDLTIELRTDKGSQLVKELIDTDGVNAVNLLSHDGEAAF